MVALGRSSYLLPPAAEPRSSTSGSVPALCAVDWVTLSREELNFSRPMAGDTKTKEFEKVATWPVKRCF